MDAAKEIARLEENIAKCSSQRDKLLQSIKVDGYEEKVCFFERVITGLTFGRIIFLCVTVFV